MAYSTKDQINFDLNWYFIDHYRHPCHVASGGGLLPKIISENDVNNDSLNEVVLKLPERYEIVRNQNITGLLRRRGVENMDDYFRDFETMARKGLFSFDKYDLENPEDNKFFLVVYPVFVPYEESYPIADQYLPLIPRTRGTVHVRFTNPFNLVKYFDKLY